MTMQLSPLCLPLVLLLSVICRSSAFQALSSLRRHGFISRGQQHAPRRRGEDRPTTVLYKGFFYRPAPKSEDPDRPPSPYEDPYKGEKLLHSPEPAFLGDVVSEPTGDVERVPVWPAVNLVTIPYFTTREIVVEEPRYRQLLSDLEAAGNKTFGLVMIDQIMTAGLAVVPKYARYGTIVEITKKEEQDDGRTKIWVQAKDRFEIVQPPVNPQPGIDDGPPYVIAAVRRNVTDNPHNGDPSALQEIKDEVWNELQEVVAQVSKLYPDKEKVKFDVLGYDSDDASYFSWGVLALFTNMPAARRQLLLQSRDAYKRLKYLRKVLYDTLQYRRAQVAVKDVFKTS
ncbi:unnamed protein product [Vitrella brassicaformis CCMP3155]|uniref:Lon N-terminal domain-containing protein n=1 Tax=Vitrella brassicaformis (strain CCMP3155) TaxID=1169540 RepID=A0A0G4EPD5_VITBC|nr:unnamed protein product [Vitrella brassicaformis CCMP3155]|eukprot:CEL99110.1 unnamed protein product [Vitrella brassicaformis CCMP3155]